MYEKPVLKKKTRSEQQNAIKKDTPSSVASSCAAEIPLMFQAQIQERGNIQYVGDHNDDSPPKYEEWAEQWISGCPPQPEVEDENIPIWKRRPVKSTIKLPQFGDNVHKWDYQIRWRMITNSGQDADLIRPVIGSKGMPFFPGSSMKGAFRNACPEEKRLRYCGGEVDDGQGNKRTIPGILRFHGGYPVNMAWAQVNQLVDITHGQQPYQVMRSTKERGENANVQISLYKPKFRFGISSPEIPLDSPEWNDIQQIWQDALGHGIGSRVSAGYGYIEGIAPASDQVVLSVNLNGQGVMSQLLLKDPNSNDRFKTPEFRPNMFKAVLRGHTLRLLGGLTSKASAESLTRIIWGGIPEQGENTKALIGKISIDFSMNEKLHKNKHTYQAINKRTGRLIDVEMPIYSLHNGNLSLIQVSKIDPDLEDFIVSLVKFSVLLGGFGKSWRRVHHKLFYPSYFENGDKPMIGCHWKLTQSSQEFLVQPHSDLSGIGNFIEEIRTQAIAWIKSEQGSYQSGCAQDWREAWHPSKVQVWGRMVTEEERNKSIAVQWFHGNYQGQKTIYNSTLTGAMGKIGRIWHRMYPIENGFVELLTIFPDREETTKEFIKFLSAKQSGFELCWGDVI